MLLKLIKHPRKCIYFYKTVVQFLCTARGLKIVSIISETVYIYIYIYIHVL